MTIPRLVPENDFTLKNNLQHRDPMDIRAFELFYKGKESYEFRRIANGMFHKAELFEGSTEGSIAHAINWASRKTFALTSENLRAHLANLAATYGVTADTDTEKIKKTVEKLAIGVMQVIVGTHKIVCTNSTHQPNAQFDELHAKLAELTAENASLKHKQTSAPPATSTSFSAAMTRPAAATPPTTPKRPCIELDTPDRPTKRQAVLPEATAPNTDILNLLQSISGRLDNLEQNKQPQPATAQSFSDKITDMAPKNRSNKAQLKTVPTLTVTAINKFIKDSNLADNKKKQAAELGKTLNQELNALPELEASEARDDVEATLISWGARRDAFPKKPNYAAVLNLLAFVHIKNM